MLIDTYGRTINYLRVSVTDLCNYRCVYCMPGCGVEKKEMEQILSYESIALIARCAGNLGITKIRLTGGEPLVRKNIETLVLMLKLTDKFEEITMTTNGSLLTEKLAKQLKKNGLTRINISLDTLEPERFAAITRVGTISEVFAGIEAAKAAQLYPIKINMVILPDTTPEDIHTMRTFCRQQGLVLQTIHHYSLSKAIKDVHTYDRPGGCAICNRLRLTADGYLKPCLFSNIEIKVDFNNICESIIKTLNAKPLEGSFCTRRPLYQVGG